MLLKINKVIQCASSDILCKTVKSNIEIKVVKKKIKCHYYRSRMRNLWYAINAARDKQNYRLYKKCISFSATVEGPKFVF